MPGHQIKSYPDVTTLLPSHFFYIIEAAAGLLPDLDKKITIQKLFSNIPCDAVFSGNVTVSALLVANTHSQIANAPFTPANSSISFGPVGSIAFDDNYLYVQTAPGEIKRAALAAF